MLDHMFFAGLLMCTSVNCLRFACCMLYVLTVTAHHQALPLCSVHGQYCGSTCGGGLCSRSLDVHTVWSEFILVKMWENRVLVFNRGVLKGGFHCTSSLKMSSISICICFYARSVKLQFSSSGWSWVIFKVTMGLSFGLSVWNYNFLGTLDEIMWAVCLIHINRMKVSCMNICFSCLQVCAMGNLVQVWLEISADLHCCCFRTSSYQLLSGLRKAVFMPFQKNFFLRKFFP